MATVIRGATGGAGRVIRPVGAETDATAGRERALREQALAEAEAIVAQAHEEAARIRAQAELDGLAAAQATLAARTAESPDRAADESSDGGPLIPLARQLERLRDDFLRRWERDAVRLAIAVARRVVRREAVEDPQIALELVRESLELAAGQPRVVVSLHPLDLARLDAPLRRLVQELGRTASVEFVGDAQIEPGGCRLTSDQGRIDQQFAAQLQRIADELL